LGLSAVRWKRYRHNPLDWLRKRGWPSEHITFDPKLKASECEYEIVRGSTHDGTMIFSYELLDNALINLAEKSSYYKPRIAEFTEDTWQKVRYTVGPLKVAIAFGDVSLPCSKEHKYPGQRERVRIAVKMDFS
jgi:hypothetical protein